MILREVLFQSIFVKHHITFGWFSSISERERVIGGAPWHLARSLVLLGMVQGNVIWDSVQLSKASFWIQVHYLPLALVFDW